MNFVLMKIEKEPKNPQLIDQFMRTTHTLKGASSMMGQSELEQLTHALEDFIQQGIENKRDFTAGDFSLFFQVVDEVEFMINSLAVSREIKVKNIENLLAQLNPDNITSEKKEESTPTEKPVLEESAEEEPLRVTDKIAEEKPARDDTQLKIDSKKIDNLLNEAAELVINNNQFKTQIDRYKGYLPRLDAEGKNLQNILWQLEKMQKEQERLFGMLQPGLENLSDVENVQKGYFQEIKTIIENLNKVQQNISQAFQGLKDSGKVYEEQLFKISSLSNQIHDEIMHARLIPIGMLFRRFHRPLRDMAANSGKKIKLYIEGESTEIDRLIAEELYDPMIHILRNAIDHGIETVNERKTTGKNEEGLIQIYAKRERNNVIITVEDDGSGIDPQKIKGKLREKKILAQEEIDKLTVHELYEYLTYPGFSTLKEAGKISGRGVGLDVVRNQIQKLKGDLRITSQPGVMTRMTIRVPISITVTQAMLVNIDDNIYAIPLLQVEETINISPDQLTVKNEEFFINFRGTDIPVIHMSELLEISGREKSSVSRDAIHPVIIVQDEGKKAGLLVDKIIQREEILIKNIGEVLQRTKYIMGGSIRENGNVVLVLDIPQIVFTKIRMKEKDAAVVPSRPRPSILPKAPAKTQGRRHEVSRKLIEGRKPLILIVDDSLSVRKFLSGVLGKHGFDIDTARNGKTAMEMLTQKKYDLIITDLEMPQVSGYELIEQIRADSQWDELPVIVLTGRASKHIQQHSLKIGANEFVIKPFKDKELLEKISTYIDYQKN
jgi:chemosensory pili system protein ChpA (sensor histidine kinase/response regulator)